MNHHYPTAYHSISLSLVLPEQQKLLQQFLGQWVMGTDPWHVTHPDLLTHLAHDTLTRYPLLFCDRLLWHENSGRPYPKEYDQDTNTSHFSQKLGKELIST